MSERLRTKLSPEIEPKFKPNQRVLTIGQDYTLERSYLLGTNNAEAVVNNSPLPNPGNVVYQFTRERAAKAGQNGLYPIY